MMMIAHALRLGWKTVVIDGKGGADWSPFAGLVEYHKSDALDLPDQVGRLVEEYERRRSGEVAANPTLIVVEEYGDINDCMNTVQAADANGGLMTIIRKGRDVRMHLCFIDQYPDRWQPQLLQNTKAKFVFWLEDGAIVKQYKVHELDRRGEFMHRGQRYRSFDMKPHVQKLLGLAAPTRYPMLIDIDGGSERMDDRQGVSQETPSTEGAGKWDELLAAYIAQHPQVLGDDLPRGTISEIARRMAAADGSVKPFENYKGVASDLVSEIREKQGGVGRNK
jgi:hypothetical protein